MPWQEFVVKVLAEVLDWPLFGLIAVLMFRAPIKAAIGRLKSIDGPVGGATFGEQLAIVEERVDSLAAAEASPEARESESESGISKQGSTYPEFYVLAQHAPAGAIMRAWSGVEKAIAELLRSYELEDVVQHRSASLSTNMLSVLLNRKIVPGSLVPPINDLRRLRNSVAHGEHDPSPGEAMTYIETAQEVNDILERLTSLRNKGHSE